VLDGPQGGTGTAEERKDLMDAKTSCWMGLREGDATEVSRKGNRDKQ